MVDALRQLLSRSLGQSGSLPLENVTKDLSLAARASRDLWNQTEAYRHLLTRSASATGVATVGAKLVAENVATALGIVETVAIVPGTLFLGALSVLASGPGTLKPKKNQTEPVHWDESEIAALAPLENQSFAEYLLKGKYPENPW